MLCETSLKFLPQFFGPNTLKSIGKWRKHYRFPRPQPQITGIFQTLVKEIKNTVLQAAVKVNEDIPAQDELETVERAVRD